MSLGSLVRDMDYSFVLGICIQKANDVLGAMCFGIVGQAQVESYAGANVYTNVYFSIQKYGVSGESLPVDSYRATNHAD